MMDKMAGDFIDSALIFCTTDPSRQGLADERSSEREGLVENELPIFCREMNKTTQTK